MDSEQLEIKRLREKYPMIVKWGRYLGSYDYYIDNECAKAEASNAPTDAIYQRDDGTWSVASEIANPDARKRMGFV